MIPRDTRSFLRFNPIPLELPVRSADSLRLSQYPGGTSYTSSHSFEMAEKSGTRITRPSEHKVLRQTRFVR